MILFERDSPKLETVHRFILFISSFYGTKVSLKKVSLLGYYLKKTKNPTIMWAKYPKKTDSELPVITKW
jgi:CTP:phosphocholine cytidylyltransferase-like protein